MPHWRAMHTADLAAAETMGAAFHVDHPEGRAIAAERLRLAPNWCFSLTGDDDELAGYCVAHPWGGSLPPGLDTLIGTLPQPVDSLHIHDVIVRADLRGQGLSVPLVALLLGRGKAAGLDRACLIAVGSAASFWARQGFVPDADRARMSYVRLSYGHDAAPMTRMLQ